MRFLGEKVEEEDNDDTSFACEDLSKMIRVYSEIRPEFAIEVKNKILTTNNKPIIELFYLIVNSNKFLTSIYETK